MYNYDANYGDFVTVFQYNKVTGHLFQVHQTYLKQLGLYNILYYAWTRNYMYGDILREEPNRDQKRVMITPC